MKKKTKWRMRKETHQRMGFFFVLFTLLINFLGTVHLASAKNEEPENLYAYSALLYDATAGRVLFEKNGYEVLPMASTTKIMTLLVVLEHTEPTDVVTVSKNAARQPDVQLNMNTGEQYYVKDLCYSLMLESHNDTAVALAEHVGGTTEGFAKLMNAKARALGAYSANFVTPNGLDAEGHGVSAADLAKIAAYAITQEEFLKITNTQSHTFTELTKGTSHTVTNKNAFLSMMEGAIGVKTGFTGKAGYCFVGAVKREDRVLVSIVLASGWPPNKSYKWSDTKKLMQYGIEAFELLPVLREQESLPKLPAMEVKKGQQSVVALQYEEEARKELEAMKMLQKGDEELSYECSYDYDTLTAPVKQECRVGELRVLLNGEEIKKIPIQTANVVVPVSFSYYFRKAVTAFFSGEYPILR